MTAQATETTPLPTQAARAIATALGAGYSPIAPGTCGTAAAIPLAWALASVNAWTYLAVCVAVTALGVWASRIADESWGTHDSGRIVVDEVAGYLFAVAAVDRSDVVYLLAGFVIFRAFDMAKPPPVRAIDRRLRGGLGVMLDDVAAGLLALPLCWAIALTDLSAHLRGW